MHEMHSLINIEPKCVYIIDLKPPYWYKTIHPVANWPVKN